MAHEIYLGPRIYGAESQSRPIFHQHTPSHDFNFNNPYNIFAQKPSNSNPFGELGSHGFSEGVITKPYMNQHRSPSRPREAQFHETQPPPFVTSMIPQSTKTKGVLNAPPPPPTPSLSSSSEGELHHQRHRFAGHREQQPSRRPSGPRVTSHGPERHEQSQQYEQPNPRYPQSTVQYESQIHERYPPTDGPERPRPTHDRPSKGGDRYQSAERGPNPSEKPFTHKEKARIPFSGVKKPLFSPSQSEKFPPKASTRPSFQPESSEYGGPDSAQDDDYYQSKFKEEYYSGAQPTQVLDSSAATRPQKNAQRANNSPSNPQQAYDFNEGFHLAKDAFNIPNFGKVELGRPFPSSTFPQSEEFKDFFETSIPEWMHDFKNPPANTPFNAGLPPKSAKLKTQETRQQNKQPQQQKFIDPEFQNFTPTQNKYLNKRNPVAKQQHGGYSEVDDYEEKQTYQNPQSTQGAAPPQDDSSFYDPTSTEFDFPSSAEFNMKDFNNGWFDFGSQPKSSGNEWIPINAPDGSVPAKSYDIPAPDLSREFFPSGSQYDSAEYQATSAPRRPSPRGEKAQASNVVYGAREKARPGLRADKRRQSEGVVSASLTVKQ